MKELRDKLGPGPWIGRSAPPRPGEYTMLFDKPLDSIECRFELRIDLPRIPIISDPSIPQNSFEIRSGTQRIRVQWPDPETELARWDDDGGARCD